MVTTVLTKPYASGQKSFLFLLGFSQQLNQIFSLWFSWQAILCYLIPTAFMTAGQKAENQEWAWHNSLACFLLVSHLTSSASVKQPFLIQARDLKKTSNWGHKMLLKLGVKNWICIYSLHIPFNNYNYFESSLLGLVLKPKSLWIPRNFKCLKKDPFFGKANVWENEIQLGIETRMFEKSQRWSKSSWARAGTAAAAWLVVSWLAAGISLQLAFVWCWQLDSLSTTIGAAAATSGPFICFL